MEQVYNPYIYRLGEVVVTCVFTEEGPSWEKIIRSYMLSAHSHIVEYIKCWKINEIFAHVTRFWCTVFSEKSKGIEKNIC